MIFIATLKVKPGSEAEFERLQTELAEFTHANEPETKVYDIVRSADDASTYICYGRFSDEAAFQYHQQTEIHERLVPPILACLAEEMDLKFYEHIA